MRVLFAIACALAMLAVSRVAIAAGGGGTTATVIADERCDEGTMARLYAHAKPAVVRIERPDGGLGTGFLFFSPRHVLTAYHVIDLGRDLTVKLANGKHLGAHVVATDSEHDLALLELDAAVDAPVLPAHVDLEVGMKVFSIGNPYGDSAEPGTSMEGLLNWSATSGTVSAFNQDMFQTDALLAPGNSGGPIFACDGGVVGIADLLLDNRIGFAVRIHRGLALAGRLGRRKTQFAGTLSLRDGALGVLAESDAADFLGAGLAGRVVAWDRVSFDARIGAMFELPRETADATVSRSVVRGMMELALGYRALFFAYSFPTYVTLSLGGSASIDRGSQRVMNIQYDDPNCPGLASCAPKLASQTQAIRGGGVEPMASLHLTFTSFDIGYAYKLDVIHPKFSTQRIFVGIVF